MLGAWAKRSLVHGNQPPFPGLLHHADGGDGQSRAVIAPFGPACILWGLAHELNQPLAAKGASQIGLGDLLPSVFFSPKLPTAGGLISGAGPVFLMPTATDDRLGAEQFGLGPTAVALRQSAGWTYGALANHLWSVTRAVLEEHWQPKILGDSAQATLDSCRQAETNIWRLAATIMDPPQEEELRQAIDAWRVRNSDPSAIFAAQALGIAIREGTKTAPKEAAPGSVFGLTLIRRHN